MFRLNVSSAFLLCMYSGICLTEKVGCESGNLDNTFDYESYLSSDRIGPTQLAVTANSGEPIANSGSEFSSATTNASAIVGYGVLPGIVSSPLSIGEGHGETTIINPTFTISVHYFAEMSAIRTYDLDQDNYYDIVYCGIGLNDRRVYVAYGLPSGEFEQPVPIDTIMPFASIALGHLNSDSLIDIVIGDSDGPLDLLLSIDGHSFVRSTHYNDPPAIWASIAVGHFNDDSYTDVIAAPGRVLFGDGTGAFPSVLDLPFFVATVDVADFDNDGFDDIIAKGGTNVTVYINDGQANFTPEGSIALGPTTLLPQGVSTANGVADFNLDGNVDFAIVAKSGMQSNAPYRLTIGLGDGGGSFLNIDSVDLTGIVSQCVPTDVNRDGVLDIAMITTSEFRILLGDGSGAFPETTLVPFDPSVVRPWALAAADFDRDGNPDFVTGDAIPIDTIGLRPFLVFTNNSPDVPIEPDEMVITAFTGNEIETPNLPAVDFTVVNPSGFQISREVRTVAGSEFTRQDVDVNGQLDQRTYDYNFQEGEYEIIIRPYAGGSKAFTLDIRVDGSHQVRLFSDYVGPFSSRAVPGTSATNDSMIFYYTMELSPSMSPANGVKTTSQFPQFEWGRLVDSVVSQFHLQIDDAFDFSSPIVDDSSLTTFRYTPSSPLDSNHVYYWHARSGDGQSWGNWTRTMAAYIGGPCCFGTTGDVNHNGVEIPDLSDLAMLISYLTVTPRLALPCITEANINSVSGVDLSDLSLLIAYLTQTPRPILPSCQ